MEKTLQQSADVNQETDSGLFHHSRSLVRRRTFEGLITSQASSAIASCAPRPASACDDAVPRRCNSSARHGPGDRGFGRRGSWVRANLCGCEIGGNSGSKARVKWLTAIRPRKPMALALRAIVVASAPTPASRIDVVDQCRTVPLRYACGAPRQVSVSEAKQVFAHIFAFQFTRKLHCSRWGHSRISGYMMQHKSRT